MNHPRTLTAVFLLTLIACSKNESSQQVTSSPSPGSLSNALSAFHIAEDPVQLQWTYQGNPEQTFQFQVCYPSDGCVDFIQVQCNSLAHCSVKDSDSANTRANYELAINSKQSTYQFQYKDQAFDFFGGDFTHVQMRVGNSEWLHAQP